MGYKADWDESYDDSHIRHAMAMQRHAAEAQRASAAAAVPQTFGFGSGLYAGGVARNYHMERDAAMAADRAAQHNQYAAMTEAARQREFEKNVMKNEAERRRYDSQTSRDLGMYAEDTKRKHSDNMTGAMNNQTASMERSMGRMFDGFAGGAAASAPSMSLYGAGGQRIGGGGFTPRQSPLASLLG